MASASSARSGERVVHWLLLLGALCAAGWLAWSGLRRAGGGEGRARAGLEPAGAVPPGPQLLITADVEALVAVAGPQLLQAGAGALLGLKELCGFEPLLAMRRVAFAMPPSSSDFAFIAETSLSSEQVLRCAELTMRKRGGAPVRFRYGAFSSVRDQRRPVGEMAIRPDGLFVLSGGQYFRDVLDQAGGVTRPSGPARQYDALHAGVRRRLGTNQLTVSSVTLEPNAEPRGVRSMGLAIDVRRRTRLRGYASCVDESSCRDALEMLDSLRQSLAADPVFSPLASTRFVQQGAELFGEGELGSEQLGPMVARLLAP